MNSVQRISEWHGPHAGPRPPESLLVIGTGSAGYRHLLNAKALGVARLSVFTTGAGVPKGPIPGDVRVETDLTRALTAGARAVVVANPTALHVSSALAAARAGCHVLIEKPLSHLPEGIEDLQAEVRRRGLVGLVGYQFRFHPGLGQIRRWLVEGAVGEVVSAHARWGEHLPAWQPWRDYRSSYAARADLGGGVLLTLSHVIDYLRWLLGEVVRVGAVTSGRGGLEIDVEDTALMHLEFATGALASVSLDYLQQPSQHDLTIVGRQGVIRWDSADGVARLDARGRSIRRETSAPLGRFRRNSLFIEEMQHFFACVDGTAEPVCPLEEGRRALDICLAARESARQGRRIDV